MLRNPLAMVGRLERCWLFTFHTPEEAARPLLPPGLEPVTRQGAAFWNVTVCRIERMRPAPLPAGLGLSYWHVGYRLYVRFHPARWQAVEGLYFVRSDCTSGPIALFGNLLTGYRFHTARVRLREAPEAEEIYVESPDAPARIVLRPGEPGELPEDSVFRSLEEAAAFLKYPPCAISVDRRGTASVVRVSRPEAEWRSRPVQVESARWTFFDNQPVRPELSFAVDPIEYRWNRGRTYRPRL